MFRKLLVNIPVVIFFLLGYNMSDNHLDPQTCKGKLNEHCQKNLLKWEYKDIAVTGPPHDRV